VTVGLLSRPVVVCDALVLRTWACGETSTIASLLTDGHGFVKVIAKAARRSGSALRPLVQSGRLIEVEFGLAPGRDLQYLRAGSVQLDPLSGATLHQHAYLLAAVELLDRCRSAGSDASQLFDLGAGFARVLSCASCGTESALFYAFELALLDRLGMTPELGRCTRCGCDGDVLAERRLWFNPASGGVVCGGCESAAGVAGSRRLSAEARRALGDLADGRYGDEPSPELRREIGVLLHRFLEYHLPGYRLPAALDLLRRPADAGEIGPDDPEDPEDPEDWDRRERA
jgi:DNA repair protein RecO (recombination protein O)